MKDTARKILKEHKRTLLDIISVTILCFIVTIPLLPIISDILLLINILLLVFLFFSICNKKSFDKPYLLPVISITTFIRFIFNVSSIILILLKGETGSIINYLVHFIKYNHYIFGFIAYVILSTFNLLTIPRYIQSIDKMLSKFIHNEIPVKVLTIDAEFNSSKITEEEAYEQRNKLEIVFNIFTNLYNNVKLIKFDFLINLIVCTLCIIAGFIFSILKRDIGTVLNLYSLVIAVNIIYQICLLIFAILYGYICKVLSKK